MYNFLGFEVVCVAQAVPLFPGHHLVPKPPGQAEARHGGAPKGRRVLTSRACRRRGRSSRTSARRGCRRCLHRRKKSLPNGSRDRGGNCRRSCPTRSTPASGSLTEDDLISPSQDDRTHAASHHVASFGRNAGDIDGVPAVSPQQRGLAPEVVRGRVAADQGHGFGRISFDTSLPMCQKKKKNTHL